MKNGPVTVFDKDGNLVRGHSDIPPQYLQGWVEFYKLKFKVTPDVLIPRPETELLVDYVIARNEARSASSEARRATKQSLTILDIGTGSGNIAISLAKNLSKAKIFATDISGEALKVAKESAKKHKVQDKIFFIKSDLLENINNSALSTLHSPLIIVTNLPYIPTSRIPYLEPSVKDFEPRIALDGGSDGFELYRKLFQQISHKFLPSSLGVNVTHTGGVVDRHAGKLELIVCEIDYTQGEIAVIEAQKYFPTAKVEVKTDLAKKQRILRISF